MDLTTKFPPELQSDDLEMCFDTEEICRDYLFKLRWPDGFRCPRCACTKGWQVRDTLFECAFCKYQVSVTSGTIFHNTRVPLKEWFGAIQWLGTQPGVVSAMELKRVVGLGSYKTAWTMMNKIRQAMAQPSCANLCGVVEVDKVCLNSLCGFEIPGKSRILVAVAAQIGPDSDIAAIRMCHISSASRSMLHSFVAEAVELGSCVRTDCSSCFEGLEDAGYTHETARDGNGKKGKARLLPATSEVMTQFHEWLSNIQITSKILKRLDGYLDEFVFRFNADKTGIPSAFFSNLLLNISQATTN